MAQWEKCLLLDSSMPHQRLGRFVYLTASPVEWFGRDGRSENIFENLAARLAECQTAIEPDLPPFQGGLAGLLSYELSRQFEILPNPNFDPLPVPDLAFGLYDFVLSWDRLTGEGWLVSQGLGEHDLARRLRRAEDRAAEVWDHLNSPQTEFSVQDAFETEILNDVGFAPQYDVGDLDGLTSNFTRAAYLQAVEQAIEYIRAGDIFQVNLSQQLRLPARCSASDLYRQLSRDNPSTFAAYFDLGTAQVVSASPERLLSGRGGQVETRPIKGTRRRTGMPWVDLQAADELLKSRKDRAENAMIVDLMRNDLSRFCLDDSVQVGQFCELERYESVFHLVSSVSGRLRPGCDVWDALRSVFPGGSVTGCPKIRAMEIIVELEQSARGAYCGSLGYVGLDGSFDFNLLIRTITAARGWWLLPVGGAIVVDSSALAEYEETWVKAAGMLQACAAAGRTRTVSK